MAWLNVMALRPARVRVLKDAHDEPDLLDSFMTIFPAARAAIELGEAAALERITREAQGRYDELLERALVADQLRTFARVGATVSYSCLYAMTGSHQRAVWTKIRALAAREPAIDALLGTLLEGRAVAGGKGRARPMRYPPTQAAFLKELNARPIGEALDIANSPDHPAYATWMQYWVLPLALLRSRELGSPAIVPVSQGAFPDRRGELLYARTRERPPHSVEPRNGEPGTMFDFDAVERKGDDLLVHHYLGASWKAPLAFEKDLDGYAFLKSLPHDWATVERTVPKETWAWIESARASGRCTHVVAYDPTEASAAEGAVAAAAAHYGVELIAKSLFDV
jgi:hypothetical protein